jgi:phosphatidate cytidylyltransferase
MSGGRWSDLTARIGSAVVMVAVGGGAILAGGLWFKLFIALSCGIMIWELLRMLVPEQQGLALQLGILSGVALLAAFWLQGMFLLPLALAPVAAGISMAKRRKPAFAGFALWICLSGLGFVWLRDSLGLAWMLWLILVVVATDVAGYFAGKIIGGPKFWPAVSPKKTWSGTSAGWVGAALVGLGFSVWGGSSTLVIVVSVLVSMASQAGDIVESALKRRTGVKDSSALIPGHGGFFDRFDGMMGAAAFLLLLGLIYVPGAN